jgi:hypothetical protein
VSILPGRFFPLAPGMGASLFASLEDLLSDTALFEKLLFAGPSVDYLLKVDLVPSSAAFFQLKN